MKIFSLLCKWSFLISLFIGGDISVSEARLIDTNQNQALIQQPQVALEIEQPAFLQTYRKLAAVQFITDSGGGIKFGTMDFAEDLAKKCSDIGFTKTTCESGSPVDFCPYDHSYFRSCCDSRYKYSKDDCAYPLTISGDSCGGKYMCYCDRSLYPLESCESPKVPTNDVCVQEGKSYYSACQCPSNYSQTCSEQNQQGVGGRCTTNGKTYYPACECKSGYNLTCSDSGPSDPNNFCLKDGIKYYNNCKTCENKCQLDSCPEGVVCNLEECSGKYCDVGCAVGYKNYCTKPNMNCQELGYTQQTSDCPDGYITCPYDQTKVYCGCNYNAKCPNHMFLKCDGKVVSECSACGITKYICEATVNPTPKPQPQPVLPTCPTGYTSAEGISNLCSKCPNGYNTQSPVKGNGTCYQCCSKPGPGGAVTLCMSPCPSEF